MSRSDTVRASPHVHIDVQADAIGDSTVEHIRELARERLCLAFQAC